MEIENTPEGVLLKRAKPGPPAKIDHVFGSLHKRGRKVPTDAVVDEAIGRYVAEKYARSMGIRRGKRRKP